jgi:hypothetical protein
LTLVHSVSAVSREGEEYGGMMSTRIIPVSGWFRDRLRVLLDRGVSSGGTGQLRVSVAGVSAETEPFTSTGRDILVIDMSETSRDAAWPILIEGKASTGAVTVDRVKIVADPTDEMAGTIVLCLLPETTCSQSTFSELARESFITAQVPLVLTDINSAVMVGMDVEISGVGVSGEIKIELIGAYGGASASESSTVAIPESGIFQAVIKFPSMVTPMTEIVIQGRITSGSGTMTLNTLQALVLH